MGRGGRGRQDPKPTVPAGLECPGGRERGWAGARSPIRAAGTVLRPGAAGGRGRWRGGQRAAAPPGRRASCRGPRGAGDPPGRRPLSGAGSPQLSTEVPRERRAPAAGCWEPSGAWLDFPAKPGGPSGAGLRLLEEGGPSGAGPPHQGAQLLWPSPGVLRARVPGRAEVPELRLGPGARGVPGAVPGFPGARGSRGYAGDLGRARVPGVRGAPGGARWDKCGGGRGRGGGRVWGARLPLSRAQRGGGRPRGRCPGSAMLLRGREGGREEGGRAARSRAGRGAGAAGAGGGEDPARGAGGRGRAGPRRAGPGRRESGRAPRPGAARRGLMGMAGARSSLNRSLAPSHTRGGRRSPQQPLPNFPNFPAQLFPLLPCPRLLLHQPSPFPSPAPRRPGASARGRQRAPRPRPRSANLCPLCGGRGLAGPRQIWGQGPTSPNASDVQVLAGVNSERVRRGQALPDWLGRQHPKESREAGIYNFVSRTVLTLACA